MENSIASQTLTEAASAERKVMAYLTFNNEPQGPTLIMCLTPLHAYHNLSLTLRPNVVTLTRSLLHQVASNEQSSSETSFRVERGRCYDL